MMQYRGEAAVITFKREELYERVWQTPMWRFAGELGISDVGLAKACKRHQIPRPTRGYWAKLQHGKKVTRKPLPKIYESSLETVRIEKATGDDRSSLTPAAEPP